MDKDKKLIIYTDGGARGNPGDAAIGVVVGTEEFAEYIGRATNNVAEYSAIIFALKKAKQILGKAAATAEIEIRADSELVVRQMKGEYKVKEENLKLLFVEASNLKTEFGDVSFTHIPREKNKRADMLVNRALDSRLF